MKLEEIGFYTLSNARAQQSSVDSPLWRCELILTDRCNFKCPYCRGLREDISGTLPYDEALRTLKIWCKNGLRNVRFSGGEPTLYPWLENVVDYCKSNGVQRIALSTNGSANWDKYEALIKAGVDDFSVSLDSCCASIGDKMAGGVIGAWEKVVENIKRLSSKVYTTVGIVINEENIGICTGVIKFADSMGVSDIRVIPSAQYRKLLSVMDELPEEFLNKYPILKYRVGNIRQDRNVRGIKTWDSKRCSLVLDDMAVAGGYHFPCIIYMREGGDPIGRISDNMRQERAKWSEKHDSYLDPICRKNCLDVCIDFNNTKCSASMR